MMLGYMDKDRTQPDSIVGNAYRTWLHRFACLLVVATFVLVASGGNVTSRDVGLAVPDGFTVFGHFLWAFPYEEWKGGIFHEHIHRLKGSVIGLLTIGLCVWLWVDYLRFHGRRWLAWFGTGMLFLVILQGVMGGLRVEFHNHAPHLETPFRVLHGVTGQLFFCTTVVAAAALSRLWMLRPQVTADDAQQASQMVRAGRAVRLLSIGVLAVLFLQLVLGAVMRHTESGLAIPDFPTSYGNILPPMTQGALDEAMFQHGYDDNSAMAYTVGQVHVHFAHRVWAIVVTGVILAFLTALMKYNSTHPALRRPAAMMLALLIQQLGLGSAVIWTGRHHDVATAHQAIGAVILALATLLAIRVRLVEPGCKAEREPHRATVAAAPAAAQLRGAGA